MTAPALRRQRRQRSHRQSFDFSAKRRREIVAHALDVGAAETEDFPRWLIAWHWYNPKAKDPIWSLMEAAKRMGGKITEAQASAITEEASILRKCWSADNLARFLGVTYAQRQALRLTTIGSVNVKRRDRREIRRIRDKVKKEQKRRAAGVRPRAEYEATSLSRTQPWRTLGITRRTWERHRNRARDASVSAPIFLSSEDRPATPVGGAGLAERRCRAEEKKEDFRLATATTMAADSYVAAHSELPLELRLMALGLDPENFGARQKIAAAA
jgi:hypothetical protein